MPIIDNPFLEFVRYSLHTNAEIPDSAFRVSWPEMLETAKKQSIVGVCWQGIQRLGGMSENKPTDDDVMDARLRSLRAGGRSPEDKYDNREIGMNSRLDTLQAAILLPKFKAFVDYELEAVNKAAKWYNERLKDKFVIPTIPEGFYSSWAQYTILLNSRDERDAMQQYLKEKGIPSMVYYPRGLHQQGAYEWMRLPDEPFPNTLEAANRVLSLPMHPYLTEDLVDKIVKVLLEK